MAFADLDIAEKEFADLILKQGMKDGSIRGTASHVITMNVYDNGRIVFKGFDVVDRKHAENKIVEAEDIKIMMSRIIQDMTTAEYSQSEKDKLLGIEVSDATPTNADVVDVNDLSSGDDKSVDQTEAKAKFFS